MYQATVSWTGNEATHFAIGEPGTVYTSSHMTDMYIVRVLKYACAGTNQEISTQLRQLEAQNPNLNG